MRPAEARDIGDAPDGRPVPVVWPRPAQVGNEKHLAGLWIIGALRPLGVALKLATRGAGACNRKAGGRRIAASDDPHGADTGRTGRWRARLSAQTGRDTNPVMVDDFSKVVFADLYTQAIGQRPDRIGLSGIQDKVLGPDADHACSRSINGLHFEAEPA